MRPLWQLGVILALGALLTISFAGLGLWQVERLGWKRDLIARVEARVHAPPVPWQSVAGLAPSDLEYRHVAATGHFDHGAETLVTAVTERGGGYWVLTPLRTGDGQTILVNRGFVPPERRDPASRPGGLPEGEVTVTGLARISEPGGAFLRQNDPGAGRWYSRDVEAIAGAKHLGPVAGFFIDADANPNPDTGASAADYPVGGLTVIRFRNTHLSYALTWFVLAAMVAGGMVLLVRYERARRRG